MKKNEANTNRFGLGALRQRIGGTVAQATAGGGGPRISYSRPRGDPGLFGPDSVCWRVHGDTTAMFVGGFPALILQALEPRTLAGVFDHSNFRSDAYGRLRRTSTFVMGTTYAGKADAEALIERVLGMHRRVTGTAPDGRLYSALDSELLIWVHVCEMYSYQRAYRRYVDPHMSSSDLDRYYDEVAIVAEKLGARQVPRSRTAVSSYFQNMRPLLVCDERTRDILNFLRTAPPPNPASKPFARLLFQASVELLPAWAQQMTGYNSSAWLRSALVRPSVQSLAPLLRWGVRDINVPARARARMSSF
ncbi:MAG: oxygenase MpaB family protein [Nevskiales bacterium]